MNRAATWRYTFKHLDQLKYIRKLLLAYILMILVFSIMMQYFKEMFVCLWIFLVSSFNLIYILDCKIKFLSSGRTLSPSFLAVIV